MSKRKYINDESDSDLKRWHAMGLIDRDVADRMGFSQQAIWKARNRLGLRPNGDSSMNVPGRYRTTRELEPRPAIIGIREEIHNGKLVLVELIASAAARGCRPTQMPPNDTINWRMI